jgi:serine/threonine protein kinase
MDTSQPRSKPAERQKIGDYLIGPTLGEGGFSTVKLGMHAITKERVALKILKNKHKMTDSIRKQVGREIAAMQQIDHVNCLKMKEVLWNATYTKKNGKKLDVILIVLELATGGELFEFLSYTGYFGEPLARTYMLQLLSGLSHCHNKGIAHRDLKPENLLMDDKFRLKIADFGFSNIVTTTQKVMYTECGTPGYMAPEMFLHKGYEGRVADIWSAGVILFIMLAGFPPFQRPSNSDWWFNKLSHGKNHLFWQAHCRNAVFSDSCKDLINKMLTPDPAKRITVTEMASHPWFKGSILSAEDFMKELTKRKAQVDVSKAREKERKRGEDIDLEGDAVMRGEGKNADSDALPQEVPSIAMGAYVYEKPTTSTSLDSSDGFDDIGSPSSPTKSKELQQLDTTVARYTRFNSAKKPDVIVQRIVEVVKANAGEVDEVGDAYRTDIQMKGVELVMEVFRTEKDGEYAVDFRRRKGDSSTARRIFADIRAQVPDLL